MTTRTFYRLSIWLPVIVPAIVAFAVRGLGLDLTGAAETVFQILMVSLVYGGVPYALIAAWGTWRLGGRSELEIRRLMLLAPFAMAAFYLPFVVIVGSIAGAPVRMTFGVGLMGAFLSIPLGFAYVLLVWLLRSALGTRLTEDEPPQPIDAHDGVVRSI
jgi:hypothetical protein